MSEQYKGFARVYDMLMNDVDYDMWADYIMSLLKDGLSQAISPVRAIDCACGTGAVTIRLKKAGLDITGMDISREMLEIASENARSAGLKIPFVCMDMQKMTVHRPHDAVISACDGVNYLTSRDEVLSFFVHAYQSLKSGGMLLFDISSRYKLESILGCNTFAEDGEKCAYIWKNMYDEKSKLIEMNLSFFERENKSYRRFTEQHIQRAHSEKELFELLENAGFEDIRAYDAFTKNAPTPQSERIQFTAIKR